MPRAATCCSSALRTRTRRGPRPGSRASTAGCWAGCGGWPTSSLGRGTWTAQLARPHRVSAPTGAARDELEKLCLESRGVQSHVDGHEIAKVIVVPDKLVNVVVR